MNITRLSTAATAAALSAGAGGVSFWLFTSGRGFWNWLGGSYLGAVAVGGLLYGGWALFGVLFPDGNQPQGSMAGWSHHKLKRERVELPGGGGDGAIEGHGGGSGGDKFLDVVEP
jgi:hypothetical protein